MLHAKTLMLMKMFITLVENLIQLSVLKVDNFKKLLAICHIIIFSLTVS